MPGGKGDGEEGGGGDRLGKLGCGGEKLREVGGRWENLEKQLLGGNTDKEK